jgi:hypothetical protein
LGAAGIVAVDSLIAIRTSQDEHPSIPGPAECTQRTFERPKNNLSGFGAIVFISIHSRHLKPLLIEELGARRLRTDTYLFDLFPSSEI